MHSSSAGSSGNVPAFLGKLWKLVEDEKYDDLICWNPATNGATFFIRNQARFAKEVLPLYFKHNNMASFVRQLNMYGFRKVGNLEQGSLRMDKDETEFHHQYFLQGHEVLLQHIKRKVTTATGKVSLLGSGGGGGTSINSTKAAEEMRISDGLMSRMLKEVKGLHSKQDSMNAQLSSMKRENETLWREVAALRQQHRKQQQIVNKLIQFLLSLVHPKCTIGSKRKWPLMLNDAAHSESHHHGIKSPRLSRAFSYDGPMSGDKNSNSVFSSTSGPVIHDITDAIDGVVDPGFLIADTPDYYQEATSPEVEALSSVNTPLGSAGEEGSPQSEPLESVESVVASGILPTSGIDEEEDPSSIIKVDNLDDLIKEITGDGGDGNDVSETATTTSNTTIPTTSGTQLEVPMSSDILVPVNDKSFSRDNFSDQLDTMQMELDALKDILSGSGCTIDTSTLMGLFTPDDFLNKVVPSDILPQDEGSGNCVVGNELTHYNSNILGMTSADPPLSSRKDGENADQEEDGLFDPTQLITLDTVLDEANASDLET